MTHTLDLYLLQIFHQILDVTDLYRLWERNAVRLEVQNLQVSKCAKSGLLRGI